jgi:hypothetical protein
MRLAAAQPYLMNTYTRYAAATSLGSVLADDAIGRFSVIQAHMDDFSDALTTAVVGYVDELATLRNLVRF